MVITDIVVRGDLRSDGQLAVFVSLALDGELSGEDDAELLARIDAAVTGFAKASSDELVSKIRALPVDVKAQVLADAAKAAPVEEAAAAAAVKP